MFKTRLLSGILLVIIALATIISGDYVLFFTLLAVSLIGMRELYRAMKVQDEKINLLAAAGYLGAVLYYLAVLLDFERYGVLAIIFGLVLLMFVYVFTYPTYEAGQVMPALFGIVYVAVMLSFIYLTRELPGGKFHVWLIFLCSWGCDTCAYCVGMLIGKHKMAPVLSPKKSVEGAVGGVAGAALLGVIYAAATQGPMLEYAVICAIGALISMVGDLAASAIKRNQGIKDYGKLIPGHHPNSVAVARYGALIRAKYPTNCDAHLAESLFQTRSNGAYILLIYMFTVFSDMRTVRSEVIL